VAGAVQDHDRGIILGSRSFGKGLVQEQIAFDDGSLLRMTVSRYYTPSGRCIQKPYGSNKEEYLSESYLRDNLSDSIIPNTTNKFTTSSGRIVYGGGGITPDSVISNKNKEISAHLINLYTSNFFENLVFDYVDLHRTYLSTKSFNDVIMSPIQEKALINKIYTWMQAESDLASFLEFENIKELSSYEHDIVKRLKVLIVRQQWGWPEMQKFLHQEDIIISTSLSLLKK